MAAQLIRTLTGTSQKSSQQENGLHPALTKMTTQNSQFGVLNHLSEAQEEKLEQFKDKLEKDGWWSPSGINGKPTHDDGTLLRYLRARKFDVQGAYGQFTDTEKWLKEQHVEELYEHFDVDFFERVRCLYPQWTGHRDRRGIPLYVYEIKGLDTKAIDKYQKESTAYKKNSPEHKDLQTPAKHLPLFALYHNLLNFVLPFVSTLERPRPEIPVTNSTNIVDISGVSLRQFWNLKNHMQDASVLATAHYPETLDRIYIIGAPSFFPTVWGWIKRWFDPVTVSKIFILSRNEVLPTLEKFIEPTSIPKKYGGKLDWTWGDVPDLDAESLDALETDGNKGWVKGPALWLNGERVVVGSANGKLRRDDKEIAEKKPIVYAADYTEDPVHAEKRGSIVGSPRKSISVKKTSPNAQAADRTRTDSSSPSTLVEKETESDTAGATTATATTPAPASTTEPDTTSTPTVAPAAAARPVTPKQSAIPDNIPIESVRTSPMGDSQVRIPEAQAAPPATTVEYISSSSPKWKAETEQATKSVEAPTAAAAVSSAHASTTISQTEQTITSPPVASSHPPGHTQPGPMSQHAAEINRMIASKLEGESIVVLPAQSNGGLSHPSIILASDTAKGLAMEEDKLALSNMGSNNHPTRPAPERFVTAAEF